MKKLTLILLVILSIQVKSQHVINDDYKWRTPKLYIPVTIIGAPLMVNIVFAKDMSYQTMTSITLTGIATSVIVYLLIPEKPNKYRKYKKRKRFRR